MTRPRLLAALAGVALWAAPALAQELPRPAPEAATAIAEKSVVRVRRMMVVSAHPAATEAGMAVLDGGGSAVDAAVAVQLVLNLVEPQSSGIGGGAFMLHWDQRERRLTTLDGRETAPSAADPDYFLRPDGTPVPFDEAVPGGRSVGVPGTLALLSLAHELHGHRLWPELLAPAIRLAEAGFPISPRLAALPAGEAQKLKTFPPTAAYFLEPDGTPKAAGTRLRNPAFASTLRSLAEEGPSAFYTGAIGREPVRTARVAPVSPGLMT